MSQNFKQDAVISVKEVSKTFTRPVLKKINLSIQKPQSLFLCGINGAGKSTLLKILAGLLQPDSGSVSIYGKCLRRETDQVKSKLGVIMHQSMVYPDLTVLENIQFVAQLYGLSRSSVKITSVIDQVGLTGFRYDKAAVLSRGLLQRLSIARSLIHDPKVIFADEPFTGLDTESVNYLTAMLEAFRKAGGTVVLTTHDMTQGLMCSDRVVIIDQTQIIFDGPTEKIDPLEFSKDYLSYARRSK